MISNVSIANQALVHLAKEEIESLTENSTEAEKISLVWDQALDATLRAHPWKFAGKVQALALISGEEIEGWTYLYKYPAHCLFIRRVFNEATNNEQKATEPYEEFLSPDTAQKSIATDVEDALIEFTARVTNPALYDSLFIDAFALQLAARTAFALTGDKDIQKTMIGLFNDAIAEAKRIDRAEAPEKNRRTSPTLLSRG